MNPCFVARKTPERRPATLTRPAEFVRLPATEAPETGTPASVTVNVVDLRVRDARSVSPGRMRVT